MHSKIARKVQICPIYPLPSLPLQRTHTHTHTHRHAHTKPPSLLTFPTRWNICYNWWTYIDTSYSKSIVYFRIHAWIVHSIVHSVGLKKHTMTCIHQEGTWQSVFTVLKNPLCSACSSLPPSPHPCNHWSFYCLISFAFSRMYFVGIIQHVAFSHWHLSLSNMHLR